MHSLVFLCAQKVVSHYATLQDALGFIPKELYPVLFKAAFLDKRTPSLQQLVQTWPFPVLSFQKLLRKCQHCEYTLIREKPNKLCIQAVILGVVTYLTKLLEDRRSNKRDLQSPLESLELAFCYLLPNDFAYLSQSLHTPALKKLDLSGNNLSDILLQPFLGLLTEAASTLLHLDIMECRLMDAQLNSLLPVLGRLSRLRYLGVFGNPISAIGLKNLLHRTLGLLDLRLVIYPYPVDCYGEDLPWPPTSSNLLNGSVDEEKFSRVSNELQQMLLSANRTDAVWTTNLCRHNSLDYFSL
ncbi:hypothetical protein JD844_015443 [Phrynosoma platyrhinos]|uniref:Leucine-rich repeat-containing protein 14 n=1 Tax=Phrynosoma platyrhinos TaxID=52577 RepID=A0ABQ7SJ36_PHRPL|nr:hypothetical protein JD844_015443 [Phrynosoma platyrhinos]